MISNSTFYFYRRYIKTLQSRVLTILDERQEMKNLMILNCRGTKVCRDLHLCMRAYQSRQGWQPTPVFLPREFYGQRSLTGYSPWGHKESDMTEWLTHMHAYTHPHTDTDTHNTHNLSPSPSRQSVPSCACGLLSRCRCWADPRVASVFTTQHLAVERDDHLFLFQGEKEYFLSAYWYPTLRKE